MLRKMNTIKYIQANKMTIVNHNNSKITTHHKIKAIILKIKNSLFKVNNLIKRNNKIKIKKIALNPN